MGKEDASISTARPLDYGRADKRPFGRFVGWCIALVILLPVGVVLVMDVPVTSTEQRMDAVTGTVITRTSTLGLSRPAKLEVSPLEQRFKDSGIAWQPRWTFLHDTQRNLFGMRLVIGCGVAPAIYAMHSGLDRFAETATDEELRAFVSVMQSGTEQEQQAAIDAAADRVLASYD